VRGKGLAIGVELVKNRKTRKPLTFDDTLKIRRAIMNKGVFEHTCGRFGNCLRISPPLTITKAHVDKSLEIISDVLKDVGNKFLE
jgi:4-aminobutyrate aminotransferase